MEPCPAFDGWYPQQEALVRKYFATRLYNDMEAHMAAENGRVFDVSYARSSTPA
jgi:hypothetical protein